MNTQELGFDLNNFLVKFRAAVSENRYSFFRSAVFAYRSLELADDGKPFCDYIEQHLKDWPAQVACTSSTRPEDLKTRIIRHWKSEFKTKTYMDSPIKEDLPHIKKATLAPWNYHLNRDVKTQSTLEALRFMPELEELTISCWVYYPKDWNLLVEYLNGHFTKLRKLRLDVGIDDYAVLTEGVYKELIINRDAMPDLQDIDFSDKSYMPFTKNLVYILDKGEKRCLGGNFRM